MCSFSTSVCTVRRSVKGGWTDTSTPGHVLGLEAQAEVAHRVQRLDVVVVHLPVPADQRAAVRSPLGARSGAWRRASMPGRWPSALDEGQRRTTAGREVADLVAQTRAPPARWRCRRRRPPRTRAVGHRLGHHPGAVGEAGVLERAQRAVPQHRAGAGDDLGEGGGRVGTDVEAGPAVGQVALDDLDAPPGPVPAPTAARRSRRARGPGCRWAAGSRRPSPAGPGSPSRCAASSSELPDVLSPGGQEGEGHAAADDQRVHLGGQRP